MNKCNPTLIRNFCQSLSALCVLLLLSACADKVDIREAEQERYRDLEEEMISAQQAEVLRRRAELRVAQRLQQLDAERSAAARQRLEKRNSSFASDNEPDVAAADDTGSGLTPSVPPLATPVIIARTDTDSGAELWNLQPYPDPTDGSPICALVSDEVMVFNGSLETRNRVIIGQERIFLRSDAAFDTEATETGFRVDAGIPIAFDRFINELTAVVDESYDRLLDTLQNGSALAVSFAFLPQLSSAETHVIEIGLENLPSALLRLNACDAQNPATFTADDEGPASS